MAPETESGREHVDTGREPRLFARGGMGGQTPHEIAPAGWQSLDETLQGVCCGGAWLRDAEKAGQFRFKMEQSFLGGGVAVQEPERPFQEIEDVGHWEVGFGATLDEFNGVGRERKLGIVGAEAGEGLQQEGFAQGV